MGRRARFDEAAILAGAKRVSAEVGPQKLTIAAVAGRSGAPVGSIYHRYKSRDEILAALWLDVVGGFQERFLAALDGGAPVRSGLAAVRFVCDWVRDHPFEARLLLLHRREDFAAACWPASYRRRALELASRAEESLRAYALRLIGREGPLELREVRFALVDLPTAALRRDIEADGSISDASQRLLFETCSASLRRAARRRRNTTQRR
jgi:AcrR family transcriptional regulator